MANKELDKKLTDLEKRFGLSKASSSKKYETVRTGIYALDYVIDRIKLIEGGHKIEFFGKESCGKTTFAKKVVAKFQELDKLCVWIVSESFHEDWARKMGVDTDKLLTYYPKSVEDGGNKILELIGNVDLIVLDSVASLISEAELKGTLSDKTRGSQAKAYTEFTRRLYQKIAKHKTVLLFINQIRIDMRKVYGNPEDTPCGKALRHLYDTRVEFRTGQPIDKGQGNKKVKLGTEIKLHGYKNKLGVAKRNAIVDFYFEDGRMDNNKTLLFAGIQYGVIEFSGKTYKFKDVKSVGKDNFIAEMDDNNLWDKVEKEIWKIQEKKK